MKLYLASAMCECLCLACEQSTSALTQMGLTVKSVGVWFVFGGGGVFAQSGETHHDVRDLLQVPGLQPSHLLFIHLLRGATIIAGFLV